MLGHENEDLQEVQKEEEEEDNVAKEMILAEGYQQSNGNLISEEHN